MSITVDMLLQLPIMKEYSTIICGSGYTNEVQYVTVAEASSINFSNLGDKIFVLTTLSNYHDSLEKTNGFIRGLCQAGISAIGIKLGRFVNEIDSSTIAIAEQYHVVLLSISPHAYFREILSETLSLITGNQRHTLRQINTVNQSLIRAIMHNRSIQDLLDILCQHLDCYCCCFDPTGKKFAETSSLSTDFDTDSVYRAIKAFFVQPDKQRDSYFQENNIFIFPCMVNNQMSAALCVVVFEQSLDVVIPLAQAIVSGISIKFLEQNLEHQARRGLVSATLDDILFSDKSDHRNAAERLELLNFLPRKFFLLLLLSRPVEAQIRNWFYTVDSIQRVFANRFPSVISFKRGSEYIVLISYDCEMNDERILSALTECQSSLANTEHEHFDLGCSAPVCNLSKMSNCYAQAKKAVQFGRSLDINGHVYLYSNYYDLGLISYGRDSVESNIFYTRIINPILDHDKYSGTDLMRTLESSFANEKMEQIANQLHLHISTLRYRLQKIEQLTGYSYFNTRDRLTLYIAYLLYKMNSSSTS